MKIILRFLMAAQLCGISGVAFAQGSVPERGLPSPPSAAGDASQNNIMVPIYFKVGRSDLDLNYGDNRRNMYRFLWNIQQIQADTNYVISRVVVVGNASPEGSLARNEQLAGQRAASLGSFLRRYSKIDSAMIEEINGGENWAGLRKMIEASENIPDKAKMLEFMDLYSGDRNRMKYSMQYYNGGRAWNFMSTHFFPELRTGGGGGTIAYHTLSRLSRDNWRQLQELISRSDLSDQKKRELQDALSRELDAVRRYALISENLGSDFDRWRGAMLSGLLNGESSLSRDNKVLLRALIAADPDVPGKEKLLAALDASPAAEGREQRIKEVGGGAPYEYMENNYLDELLVSKLPSTPSPYHTVAGEAADSTLASENWRRIHQMVAASELPQKDEVLSIIDSDVPDEERLRQLKAHDAGRSYEAVKEMAFLELLCDRSPAAQQNWAKFEQTVAASDLPDKERVMDILRSMPQSDRELALKALDNGMTWNELSALLLPTLLQDSEPVQISGSSGITLQYEASPRSEVRQHELTARQKEEAVRRATERFSQVQAQRAAEARQRAEEQARAQEAERLAAAQRLIRYTRPLIGIKTDLMLWTGVMPNFSIGAWTPNLSAEVYFAKRWSAQVGWSYSDWNSLSGQHSLYATHSADLEARYWFSPNYLFKGFYIGAYGQYGEYDVQKPDKANGWTGSFYGGGLGVGYLLPLSKRWFFEAQLRGGYRSADNEVYYLENGVYYLDYKETVGKFNGQLRLQIGCRFGKSGK